MSKFKPILFSTPMVQAIQAGRKTQTRRIIKSQHESGLFQVGKKLDGTITEITSLDWDESPVNDTCNDIKPIANVGDILWVRETWCDPTPDQSGHPILYKADFPMVYNGAEWDSNAVITLNAKDYKWKPSIFMHKEDARIFLKVTNVRAERLQDIPSDDSKKEGIDFCSCRTFPAYRDYSVKEKAEHHQKYHLLNPLRSFKTLWQSINGLDSWDKNPYVWVYEFEQIEKPKDFNNG